MSRWFRHYAGMMRDEKLVRVALASKQPIERVLWIWGAILESAAEINDGGKFDLDYAEVAYFLRADDGDVRAIATSLEDCGRIAESRVVKWGDRQFKSDDSAERVRRYRARHGGDDTGSHERRPQEPERDRNDQVTLRNAPETETETETKAEKKVRRALTRAGKPDAGDPQKELEAVLDSERAHAVVDHRRKLRKPLTQRAAKLLAASFAKTADPNASADAMIANGWQGFDPSWLANRQPRANGPPGRRTYADASVDWIFGEQNSGSGSESLDYSDVKLISATPGKS